MNQNSKTDLITLTHPLMLLSIFVLLINDHVLKIHFPSALTGKISDFAGLFFFPILLSAIFHFVLKSFQFQSRNIALISFGFTAIFFSLLKTVPFFNDFIENLFSIQIILDPSDLMALIMLPLAWKLRQKVANVSKTGISKLSYVVLGIASLATIATSPAYSPIIDNLIVYDSIIYAGTEYDEENFYSIDGGKTWEILGSEVPQDIKSQIVERHELPVTLCLVGNPQKCYQTGDEIILESDDGGKTWQTSWAIPLGRKEFMERVSFWNYFGPFDIVEIEVNGNINLIAAAGNKGVLLKEGDGNWMSIGVVYSEAMQFRANSLTEAMNLLGTEFLIIVVMTVIFLLIDSSVNKNQKQKFDGKLFLIVPFGSYLTFILWAFAIIPIYEISLFIAIGLHIILLLKIDSYRATNTSDKSKENE